MRVWQIAGTKFGVHAQTHLVLPERGVVVVQGANGSGKSSIPEMVAVAGWGRTLRGEPPPMGKGSGVAVRSYTFDIQRDKAKAAGAPSLNWAFVDPPAGATLTHAEQARDTIRRLKSTEQDGIVVGGVSTTVPGEKFESNTHAQAALEEEIGSFEIWRRTCVFSSSDAAHFSLATDGERKRFLEQVLVGLAEFEPALERCRAELRKAEAAARSATSAFQLAARDTETSKERLERARSVLADAGANDTLAAAAAAALPDEAEMTKLRASLRSARQRVRDLEASLEPLNRAGVEESAALQQAQREAARWKREACPTCDQPIPAQKRSAAEAAVAAAELAAVEAVKAAKAEREAVTDQLEEAREEQGHLSAKYERLAAALAGAEAERTRAAAARRAAENAAAEEQAAATKLTKATAHEAACAAALEEALRQRETLEAVDTVLGLRGVRAQVLSHALAGVTAVANAWLPRLGKPGLTVELQPYTEKKTGGINDAISIVVGGAGGGKYRGCSGGERRRIDLAILLGLCEVAAAASGHLQSTLWFDELFDALDSDGVQAVAEAIVDLAEERCVVVITHNDELAARIPASVRWTMDNGRVEVK